MTKKIDQMTNAELYTAFIGRPLPESLKRQADLGQEATSFDNRTTEPVEVDGVKVPSFLAPSTESLI